MLVHVNAFRGVKVDLLYFDINEYILISPLNKLHLSWTFTLHTHTLWMSLFVPTDEVKQRRGEAGSRAVGGGFEDDLDQHYSKHSKSNLWRRILLLIIAITVHNIPGVCVCLVIFT